MKAIPPHPGLPSEFQGRPEDGIPDAGSQRDWRAGEPATAYHGDTRPRVARRVHAARTACRGRVGVQVAWRGVAGVIGRARGARTGGGEGRGSARGS